MKPDFDLTGFRMGLDALTIAAHDNLARAHREVSLISSAVTTEEIVQGHLVGLREAMNRTAQLKSEIVEMLTNHRRPQLTYQHPKKLSEHLRNARDREAVRS